MLIEAEVPGIPTDDFSKSLDDTINRSKEKIKNAESEYTEKKKDLEDLSKDNKMHIDQTDGSIRVSKSDPAELRQLSAEKTKLLKHQDEIKNQIVSLEKDKVEDIKDAQEEIKVAQDMKAKINTFNSEQLKATKEAEAQKAAQAKIQAESFEPERTGIMIKRSFARMEEQEGTDYVPKKTLVVNFDKTSEQPFQVKFTERGFLIGDTRLSFEILEVAISKEFNIVLNNGTGLVLDAVRMQKILKYKDRV